MMPSTTLLLVDDDRIERGMSAEFLTRRFPLMAEEAQDGIEALARLGQSQKPRISLILLDLVMPRMDGRTTLGHIRRTYPSLPVIMLSGTADVHEAVTLMREGATDFICKPLRAEQVRDTLGQYLPSAQLQQTKSLIKTDGFSKIIGAEQGLCNAIHLARKAATSDITVLITGESGTGKEVLARAIHYESARKDKPFVALNCGAIPEALAESILFGHEKGAFTGAVRREIGKFREAAGGTLFLDEVAELKPDLQTKLLRALQEREVQPVGAGRAEKVDVRIISATNRNLQEAVAQGRFREDLYYRLHIFPIHIPRLNERHEDIPELAAHLLARFCAHEHREPLAISQAGMRFLCEREWPGNVRELDNVICRAAVLCDRPALDVQDFRMPYISQGVSVSGAYNKEYAIRLMKESGQHKTRHEIEDEAIVLTLRHCGNNVAQAAHFLGMGQSTLYKRVSALRP